MPHALALALALLAATAWGAPTQTRSLFSSGGRAAGGGGVQISGNIGDVLVGPSLGGTTTVWNGFWAPNLQQPVAVDGQPKTACSFYLASPRPNPARGSAAIEYGLPRVHFLVRWTSTTSRDAM